MEFRKTDMHTNRISHWDTNVALVHKISLNCWHLSMKTFTGKECLSCSLGVERWLSLWHVHTNEWVRNRSACLLSREIIQHSALVSVHKGHTVQLCIFMLYWAGASAQTKPVIAAINRSLRQLLHVNQMSGLCHFFRSSSTFTRQICCPSLWHWGCLLNVPLWLFMLQFP